MKALGFERLILYRPAALVGGDRDVSACEHTGARAHALSLCIGSDEGEIGREREREREREKERERERKKKTYIYI